MAASGPSPASDVCGGVSRRAASAQNSEALPRIVVVAGASGAKCHRSPSGPTRSSATDPLRARPACANAYGSVRHASRVTWRNRLVGASSTPSAARDVAGMDPRFGEARRRECLQRELSGDPRDASVRIAGAKFGEQTRRRLLPTGRDRGTTDQRALTSTSAAAAASTVNDVSSRVPRNPSRKRSRSPRALATAVRRSGRGAGGHRRRPNRRTESGATSRLRCTAR